MIISRPWYSFKSERLPSWRLASMVPPLLPRVWPSILITVWWKHGQFRRCHMVEQSVHELPLLSERRKGIRDGSRKNPKWKFKNFEVFCAQKVPRPSSGLSCSLLFRVIRRPSNFKCPLNLFSGTFWLILNNCL